MSLGADILARLEASGLRLRADGDRLVVWPREAITDALRSLMRDHKAALLAELTGGAEPPVAQYQAAAEPEPSPLQGSDCSGCDRLEMREEPQPGTRRRFVWRCGKGHEPLIGRNYGERIILAPPECDAAGDFTPWKAGTR